MISTITHPVTIVTKVHVYLPLSSTIMQSTNEPPPRFSIALAEYVAVAGITSALFVFLYPAVNAARSSRYQPPLLPWLAPYFAERSPTMLLIGVPALVCLVTWLVFFLFRAMLPIRWKAHSPWFKSKLAEIDPFTPR